MTLKSDVKFEEKLTCGLGNDVRYMVNSTEELSFMTMKNNAKFEGELTCRFKIDIGNLTNFDPSTWKSQIFSL